MLRGMRKASSNWLGKTVLITVMGLLIVSFAVWGIADIFRGFGQSTLAKVGSTEIGIEAFRQTYNDRLQQLGRQFGRPLTPAQARSLGFDRQILQQVIAETALDEQARRMGLGVSDAEVSKTITEDPSFRGVNGQFDPVRFQQTIRQFGYTEQRYVAEQRRLMLRRQIATTLTSGITPPNTQVEAFLRIRDEQRNVEYVKLDAAQAGTIETPSDSVLQAYFDQRKALFRAPEFRKVSFVALTPAEVAKTIQISDDDARKIFNERIARYSTPERRQIAQIVFPNIDEARAARERIKGGLSFADLATERKLSATDIDLGLQTKAGIVDRAVADAAFALPIGEVSDAIQGRFGGVIVEVRKIEPGVTPTFEEKAAEVKAELAQERARTEIQQLYNKMEDERGGGAPVAEAAAKIGLKPIVIEAIDRQGRAPDGKPVENLPQGMDLVSSAFAADVGYENDPVQAGGGYIWYEVTGVTPSRERSFNEVKDQVAARWREDEIANRLKAKADDLVAKLNAGAKFNELAASIGAPTPSFSALFKRSTTDMAGISPEVIEIAFRTKKGGAAQARGAAPTELIVFRVNEVIEPKLDLNTEASKSLVETLRGVEGDEMLQQYIQRVQNDIGTSVNEAAFNQITGAAAPAF